MGVLENLNERFRMKRAGNMEVMVDDSLPESIQQANYQELAQFMNDIKKAGKTRKSLIEDIEEMSFDSIIASAMELLADDATQEDNIKGKTVWVESDDPDLERELNEFLEDINIEENIWNYAYCLGKYGDMYLKTYHSEFEEDRAPDEIKDLRGYVFEQVDDISTVSELEKCGFSTGFAETVVDGKKEKTILHPKEDYIHFVNDRMKKRDKVRLKFNRDGKEKSEEFKVKYGTSAFDAARQAWAMLDMIETLLLYVRYGKAAFYRMIKVEVGGASRNEAIRILRDIKSKFNVQDNLDVNNKTYRGVRKPLPNGENIYLTTKQGKGDVVVDQVGGDTDIKEILDLEYWRNKLFAALKMPKAYLGFEETQPGGLGNMSLTRQDIRYARTVKVVKRSLKNGVTDMCNFHLEETGREGYEGKFTVCMAKVMSAEVSDVEEEMLSNINLATALKDLLSDAEGVDSRNMTKVIIDKILNLADEFPEFFEEDKNGKSKNKNNKE